MKQLSLSLRLAIFIMVLGIVLSSVLFALAYWLLDQELDRQAHQYLQGRLLQVKNVLAQEPHISALGDHAQRFLDILIGHEALHLAIALPTSRQALISFSPTALQSLHLQTGKPGTEIRWFVWSQPDAAQPNQLLSLTATASLQDTTEVAIVLTMQRLADQRLLRGFANSALLTLPWILLIIALGAWGITRQGLVPLRRFRRATASITAANLSARIAAVDLPPELQELARAFNKMLDSLEDSVRRLSEFSGDLAHEMRTPLSNLLGVTQVALSQPRSAEHYREVLASNIEELARLGRLVRDMLFLARADEAQAALQRQSLSLQAEVQTVVDYFQLMAELRELRLTIKGQATAYVDRSMLQRALSNLLSNAIRHAWTQTEIVIEMGYLPRGNPWISVRNLGDGIEERHCLRLFERFYRAQPQANRHQGSTGLGLAIVQSIMDLHAGEAIVSSVRHGETVFRLIFPPIPHR